MFNYDWFHGTAFMQQHAEARRRCIARHFEEVGPDDYENDPKIVQFANELEIRTLIYLRDGFSYEMREIADVDSKSHLVFECEPVDEQYKVGAFIVTVPFDEIIRVEAYSVHPNEKPTDWPQITGFRNHPDPDRPAPPRS